jgi:putative transposase
MRGITSFKRLKVEKYLSLLSHYIYTACQMAFSIYKSFRKLKKRGHSLKKQVIMPDDYLFSYSESADSNSKIPGYEGDYHESYEDQQPLLHEW